MELVCTFGRSENLNDAKKQQCFGIVVQLFPRKVELQIVKYLLQWMSWEFTHGVPSPHYFMLSRTIVTYMKVSKNQQNERVSLSVWNNVNFDQKDDFESCTQRARGFVL